MRISSLSVRSNRRALRRATTGAIAMSPKYDAEEADETEEVEELFAPNGETSPLLRARGLVCRLWFLCLLCICSTGNDNTSVGPILPRYARFHRAISEFVTRQTVTASAGRRSARRARERNSPSSLTETRTSRWRFKIMSAMGRKLRRVAVLRGRRSRASLVRHLPRDFFAGRAFGLGRTARVRVRAS